MKHLIKPAALLAVLSLPAFAEEQSNTAVLDTVVVSASRNEMPLERVGSSITVLTAAEIAERGYTNLADLLRTTPGVAVSNSGGAGAATSIRIRGEEGFRTKILIDGIDVSDPTGTQVQPQLQHISTAEIERIEILRGPQGMMYGADAGGVINIITKRANSAFEANSSVEAGRYNTNNVSGNIRGRNDQFDYSISASNQSTEGFNAQTADNSIQDKDGYKNRTFSGRFGLNITEELRAQLTLRDVDAKGEYDGFGGTNYYENTYEEGSQKLDLIYKTNAMKHILSYSLTDFDRQFGQSGSSPSLFKGKSEQGQYIGTVNLSHGNVILFGLDQREDQVTSGTNLERDQTGVYTEWQGAAAEKFFYTLGLRHDDNDDFGSHMTYRATAAWLEDIGNNQLKYKASYGTGFRAPALQEIAYNAGSYAFPPASLVTLKEETSEGADMGIELYLANGFSMEAVYFYQTVTDEIFFDLSGFSGYLQATGDTTSKGIELNTTIPVSSIVTLLGNYTYNDTENSTGDQRIRRPRHYGNIGARFTLNKISVLGNMRFSKDSEDTGQAKLDDYEIFDVSASYTVGKNIEVYIRGTNIFDEDYEEIPGYNTAGTSYYTGVRVQY